MTVLVVLVMYVSMFVSQLVAMFVLVALSDEATLRWP
jgi:hypothetical protein